MVFENKRMSELHFCCYGKLPAFGDFIIRGDDKDFIHYLDQWFQRGLQFLQLTEGSVARQQYLAAPAWNFLWPDIYGQGKVGLGIVIPSHDRVGRLFPWILFGTQESDRFQPAVLAGLKKLYWSMGGIAFNAVRRHYFPNDIEQVFASLDMCFTEARLKFSGELRGSDDILSILGAPSEKDSEIIYDQTTVPLSENYLPWVELPVIFDVMGSASYWWTNQFNGGALRGFVHHGGLTASLLKTLFKGIEL